MTALRAGVKLAGFVAMTLPGLPVQRALISLSARGARRFPQLYHRAVTRWLDVSVNIIGEPVRDRPCLIASNHVSWLDITVLSAVTPLSFIAKK
jgi:lyso-ornithine lipid O-acyltransferase